MALFGGMSSSASQLPQSGIDWPDPDFGRPLRRMEGWKRRAYCKAMEVLGYDQFVVGAQGARFLVGTVDLIDRSIAHFGMWEGPQLDDLARMCRQHRADAFLDIGANTGFYSVILTAKGLVDAAVAFEPDPGNYARLLANLHLNGLLGKVRALPLAAGSEAGEVTLSEAGGGNRGESWIVHPDKPPEEAPAVATHTVRQIRVDDAISFSGKTLVIKMDVEGSEFHALAGMRRTLTENRCYLQVELYSDRIDDLKSFFSGLGYTYLHTRYIDHFFTNLPAAP